MSSLTGEVAGVIGYTWNNNGWDSIRASTIATNKNEDRGMNLPQQNVYIKHPNQEQVPTRICKRKRPNGPLAQHQDELTAAILFGGDPGLIIEAGSPHRCELALLPLLGVFVDRRIIFV